MKRRKRDSELIKLEVSLLMPLLCPPSAPYIVALTLPLFLRLSSYRIIIRAIYLVNMSLEEVAYRYHHTYRTTQRIHNKALREIYKIKFSKKMSYDVV